MQIKILQIFHLSYFGTVLLSIVYQTLQCLILNGQITREITSKLVSYDGQIGCSEWSYQINFETFYGDSDQSKYKMAE